MLGYYIEENIINKDEIIDYDQLWESALKCQKGVRWKPSVKQFIINAPTDVLRMHDQLKSGTWKNGRPRDILILYPKRREGLSVSFRDRVYQRSINDNALYPEMTRHFIFDNCACQKGKGTDFARRRLNEHLINHYHHHKTNGYILQIDVAGYYPNMRHGSVYDCFKRYLPDDIYKMVEDVLKQQYKGEIGFSPGSQMVQIAGISLLNDIDHYIKERLHIKHYLRYMDDLLLIHDSADYLGHCLAEITIKLSELGFEPNKRKTQILPIKKGFKFLGFKYKITETGKILMFVDGENVKHERRKLARMTMKCKRGELSRQKVDEQYKSWKAHASRGNSYKLIQRMDEYYKKLWRNDGDKKT